MSLGLLPTNDLLRASPPETMLSTSEPDCKSAGRTGEGEASREVDRASEMLAVDFSNI